jgi:hypothetical protein
MKAERVKTQNGEWLPYSAGKIDEFRQSGFSATRAPQEVSFPEGFRPPNNGPVPLNCFLLSAGFGLPSLARLCSCSALSVVSLGCSVAFDSVFHSILCDFLCSFSLF